jgi:hypothetical protein
LGNVAGLAACIAMRLAAGEPVMSDLFPPLLSNPPDLSGSVIRITGNRLFRPRLRAARPESNQRKSSSSRDEQKHHQMQQRCAMGGCAFHW